MPVKPPAVLILHNLPGGEGNAPALESEAGVLAEVEAVAAALARLGLAHRRAGVRVLQEVPAVLAAAPEAVVFNLVEGFTGAPHDANHIPALCAAFGKGCTGGDSDCLALTLDKWRSKAVLQAAGVPAPEGVIVPVGAEPPALPAPPYIVKPVASDASEGIHGAASIFSEAGAGLREAVRRIHREFGQPALVERFVGRRELNVSVVEREAGPETLPIAEIDFSALDPGAPAIVDYAAKWLPESAEYQGTPRVIPAPLDEELAGRVRKAALAAWRAVGCRDYARVDFRLDGTEFYALEVNSNPDISPDAGFVAALAAAGIGFDEFVMLVVSNAASRAGAARRREEHVARGGGEAGKCCEGCCKGRHAGEAQAIRYTKQSDRDAILALVAATGFFRPDEIDIAREVLDAALAAGDGGHYQSFAACLGDRVVGWLCFGPTACTVGTFDIYWVAVSPECQGKGVGRALMAHAERLIAERGGRLSVVETSGRPDYEPTRRFYLRLDYKEASRVQDFYAPGDDKVIYTKTLS